MSYVDGYREIKLETWIDFTNLVNDDFNQEGLVYRGQRKSDWGLESSLTRISSHIQSIEAHLENFKLYLRGRTEIDLENVEEIDLWAMGQHHGLATPLLDWTSSPFVGLFFAFCEASSIDQTEHRAVYVLNEKYIKEVIVREKPDWLKKSNEMFGLNKQYRKSMEEHESIRFYRGLSHSNKRIVSQSGVLTSLQKSHIHESIDKFLKGVFKGSGEPILTKILVPNHERENCLIGLNKMNINHLTLFPDLTGAGLHANLQLELDNYH